ncbi:MAG: hypothetical protein RIS47_484 [Bacteroidota bacterium]|jgi:tetratricopeptide (TPR) repeat protein
MAIGGQTIIDDKGKKFWADKQSECQPLSQEQETKLQSGQTTLDEMIDMLGQNRFSSRQLIFLGQTAGRFGNAWITEMAFTEAIELEPENGQAYGDLISYYAATSNWESCQKIWANAMVLATEKYYIRYHFGRALYLQEKYAEALVEAQAALSEVNFDHEESVLLALHCYLGRISSKESDNPQRDFSEAKQVWQAALVRFPKSLAIKSLEAILSRDEYEA